MTSGNNRLGATGDKGIGLRIGRYDIGLGRDTTLEVVAGICIVACRSIPFVDRNVEAVDEARTNDVVAMVLIEQCVVVNMEGVTLDIDRAD